VFQLNVSRTPSDTDNGRARNVRALNWLISPQASGRSLVLTTYKPVGKNLFSNTRKKSLYKFSLTLPADVGNMCPKVEISNTQGLCNVGVSVERHISNVGTMTFVFSYGQYYTKG